MTTSLNPFKDRMLAGTRQTALWMTAGSATATEICAGCGFDCLVIDMEHSPNDLVDIVDHLRAAGERTPLMARLPWNEPVVVKRVLDAGMRSLMFPFVQSAEEARSAVRATRYPPHGIRGIAGTARAADYGRRANPLQTAAASIAVLVQLETPEAMAQAGEIAAVDGVDCVFIGPNDLAANMGLLGQAHAQPVRALMREALGQIKTAGKAAGALDFKADGANELFEWGFDFLAVGGEASLLVEHGARLAARFKTP